MSTPHNDNVFELAARERPGQRELVETLFAQHAPAVRLFLRGRLLPQEQIDDVVQELFTCLMSAKRLKEKVSQSTGSTRSYLLTATNNLLVDRQRRRRVRSAHAEAQRALEEERAEERTPERILAAQLELEAIMAALLTLPVRWRVAFALQRFRNMSYRDIAVHMGVTESQVQYYLRQAMRRLYKVRRKFVEGERPC